MFLHGVNEVRDGADQGSVCSEFTACLVIQAQVDHSQCNLIGEVRTVVNVAIVEQRCDE